MKWEILCLTQPARERFLHRLKSVLVPQLESHSDIRFVTRLFDKKMDLGSNRQAMIDDSTAEWVNFIDDDDLVAHDYVSSIRDLLDDPIDYVGFRLQLFIDGTKQKPTVHSLRYKEWNADQDGFYRDISHLNPIRREITSHARMSGGVGEDARWAEALRTSGLLKHEHFIDRVLYFYYFRTNKNDQDPVSASQRLAATNDPMAANFFAVGHNRPVCPRCGSTACGIAGGLRRCNQCGASWI